MGEPKLAECDEVKITPEMIEAGLSPLFRFHRERDLAEEVVAEIFAAMTKARPRTKGAGRMML